LFIKVRYSGWAAMYGNVVFIAMESENPQMTYLCIVEDEVTTLVMRRGRGWERIYFAVYS